MLSKDCSSCVYCFWAVGVGQGVRCQHEENQKYDETYLTVISQVPDGCTYYEKKGSHGS